MGRACSKYEREKKYNILLGKSDGQIPFEKHMHK
jgi:hypothetical protein